MSWFSSAIHSVGHALGDVGHAIGSGLSKVGSLASFIPGIGTIAAPILTTLGNVLKPGGGLKAAVTGLPSALAGAIPGVGGLVGGGLSTIGNLFSKIPGIGNVANDVGGFLGGVGKDIAGGLSKIGDILPKNASGGTDWGKLANLGLGAMDAYNAAQSQQKSNSLLNKGIGQYNDNWNQGKATIMNPAPLPIAPGSQASNPFARGNLDPQVQALQAYLSQQPPKP